jgi:hypothetical protein
MFNFVHGYKATTARTHAHTHKHLNFQIMIKVKSKVDPRRGHEDPEGEQRCNSTRSLTSEP